MQQLEIRMNMISDNREMSAMNAATSVVTARSV
jgi:hypothetical protein